MGNFKKRQTEMFAAVCDECHNECEVPFKPTGNKPVLCRDCFNKQKGGGDRRRSNNRRGFRESSAPAVDPKIAEELARINEKLDRLIRSLAIRSSAEPKMMDFDFEEE